MRSNEAGARRLQLYTERNVGQALSDIKKRHKAYEQMEKLESLEFKTQFKQRECVQLLNPLENAYKKAEKEHNTQGMQKAKEDIIAGLDTAAASSMGRILAEIEQVATNSKKLIEVGVSVEVFYNGFEKLCDDVVGKNNVTKEELNKILKPYLELNLVRIESLSKKFDYDKAVNKLKENLDCVNNTFGKEQSLEL